MVGFYINKIIDRKIYSPNNIKPVLGTFIYRNYDKDFVSHLNKDTAIRKIKINLKVEFKDSKLIVTAIDEDNNCIQNFFKIDIQKAKNENQKEYFNEQISRLGNTIFEINNIENNLPEDLFIPASIIKQIKNKIVDDLLITRKQNYPKEKTRYNKNLLKDIEFKFAKELNYSYNIANNLSEKFYKIFGAELIEPAFELQKNFVGKLLMTTKYCIRYEIDQCPKYNLQSNNQNLFLENNGNLFKLVFDCKNCLMKIYYEKAKDSSNRCK
ncbi:MAG TPA: DUF3656 domain-containing protein [Ignavibacteriales bacterium]|nr:DUF3656 domain-containing protein [Ignavibacteriales bacterium]